MPPDEQPSAYHFEPEDFTEAGYPPLDPKPEAEWTVIVYYGGSSNLEPALLRDIDEFKRGGGSGEDVRVIVLMDRLPITDADDDETVIDKAYLFELVLDDGGQEIAAPQIDLGEIDSGDGLTFARFMAWSIQQYPARNYAVALGGHGAGWRGIITDEVNHSIISLTEMQAALLTAQGLIGRERPFALLINDACLMSSVEYHAITAPFFGLSYASPEIVVNPALDMTRFLNGLRENVNNPDLLNIGAELTTVYINEDMAELQTPFVSFLSHAVTDLTRFDAVTEALDEFAALFLADPERYAIVLGDARANVHTYSQFLNHNELIDLGHLMRHIIASNTDETMKAAAQGVIDALDSVRTQSISGERMASDAGYHNIYFPAGSGQFEADYMRQSPIRSWGEVLRAYYQQMTAQSWAYIDDLTLVVDDAITPTEVTVASQIAFHPPTVPKVELSAAYPQIGNVNTGFAVETNVVGRNIARGQFTADYIVSEDRVRRLLVSPIYTEILGTDGFTTLGNEWASGVDVGTFFWDAVLYVVDDGMTSAMELITFTDETGALHGRYQTEAGGAWHDATVLFDVESGEVQRVIEQNNGIFGDITIPDGATFQSYYEYATNDGRTIREPGTRYTWGDLRMDDIPALDGDYNLRFEVITHGGAMSGDTFQITVDNTDAFDGVTGFIDLTEGIALSLPATWSELEFVSDEFGEYFFAVDDTETTFYLIWLIDSLAETLEDIALDFIDEMYFTTPYVLVHTSLDGKDAIFFEAAIEWDDIDAVLGYVVIHRGLPYAFVTEGVRDSIAIQTAAVFINESVRLIDQTTAPFWDVDILFDVVFPIPSAWLPTREEQDIWDIFTAPEDDSGLTRLWLTELDIDMGELDGEELSIVLRDDLVADYLPAGYTVIDERTYFGEYFIWQATLYIDEARGVRGRIYVSAEGDSGYAVRMEAPLEDTAIFAEIFEPILDGFRIE